MQDYLTKHLEIFCKHREGNAKTFNTSWQIYQESLTIRVKKTCKKNLTFRLARNRNGKRRQAKQLRKTRQEVAVSDAEEVTYEAGGF